MHIPVEAQAFLVQAQAFLVQARRSVPIALERVSSSNV
tara:strand:- start:325980 stop:326093 length:114 start_codon:yes stop_codon:yes gene_type:complete